MSTVVRIPTPLRKVTNGDDKASVEGDTLSQIVNDLESKYPGIKERLCDEDEQLRHFVNIYINGEDVRFLEGLATPINSGDEISIVPAVAGGAY
jgi:molybdopterin synthase sulfur carrier subunit